MNLRILVSLAFVAGLYACGGGGGSTAPDAATSSTSAPTVTPPPAAVNSQTLGDAIVELNRLRTSSGMNAVVANAQVMTAAQNHATYLTGIITATSLHTEDAAKLGFTGATVSDRVKAAGYDPSGSATEVVDPDNLLLNTKADPLIPLRALMNIPYHGLILLSGNQDVGIGLGKTANGQTMYTVINLASKSGGSLPIPTNEVRMWPCNGVDNILHKSITPEDPNPIAGRNLQQDPIGTPIYVFVSEGQKLVLTTYELRNTATGTAAVIAKVLGQDVTDGLGQNQVAILPDKPLAVNTVYTAAVTGLNGGKPFSKTCTFKTGNLSAFS